MRRIAILSLFFFATSASAQDLCPKGYIPVCAKPISVPIPKPTPTPTPTPSPSPSPTPTPLPGGALFSEDFESGDLKAWTETAQQARISQDQAHTGNYSLRVDQAAFGWGGELQKELGDSDQVYISLWWYIPSNFVWNRSPGSGGHFWRLGGAGGNQLDSQSDGGWTPIVFWGTEKAYFGIAALPQGRWFRLSLWLKLNTPGQANGEIRVWEDGVQVFSRSGEAYRSTADPIQRLRLVTNYDGCDAAKGTCSWYYDDIVVGNTIPEQP